jgi:hypothetical protein
LREQTAAPRQEIVLPEVPSEAWSVGGDALLQRVIDECSPESKQVYADWLDDNGQSDLAFAYRWAARRGKYPSLSLGGRCATWYAVMNPAHAGQSHKLPAPVIDAMAGVTDRRVTRFRNCAGVGEAFEVLAEALAKLRRLVEL